MACSSAASASPDVGLGSVAGLAEGVERGERGLLRPLSLRSKTQPRTW